MNSLKRFICSVVSTVLYFSGKVMGPLHAPWTKKRLHYSDVLKALNCLKKGDVILTRTKGELTTFCIPGHWKHSAIYIGEQKTIEATGKGVIENWLPNLIMRTDYIAVMRCRNLTLEQVDKIVKEARTFIGKEYDYKFNLWDKGQVYCSEIVYHSVNAALGDDHIELRPNFFGYPSFTPDDCYKARKKFDLILQL